MIAAVIFDMDGLLVDSEPFWLRAELEVYKRLGLDLRQHMNHETSGLRIDASVLYWYDRFPWVGKSLLEVQNEILQRVEELVCLEGKPKPGALDLVRALADAKVPLAVCSSSPLHLIKVALKQIAVIDYFPILNSAESEAHGKPHPAAYLKTAERLKIAPQKILVFEDSFWGAIAAKAARMKVVAVPEAYALQSSRFDFCDQKISSLAEFDVGYFLKTRVLKA